MALMGVRSSGYRTYETYENAKNNNREIELSFNWELRFTKKPTGVYFPPDLILNIRLQSVEPPKLPSPTVTPVEVNGWKVLTYGKADYSGLEFSGEYQDFIDQSIEYCFREITYETDRPLDHTQKPKEELLWDADLFQLDTQDRPLKVYKMRDCLLSNFSKTDQMDHDKTPGGKVSLGWTAGITTVEQLNIPRV